MTSTPSSHGRAGSSTETWPPTFRASNEHQYVHRRGGALQAAIWTPRRTLCYQLTLAGFLKWEPPTPLRLPDSQLLSQDGWNTVN